MGFKLTSGLLEHFRASLDQQEAKLADQVLLATLPPPGKISDLHLHGSGHMRLSQALQIMTKRVKELHEGEMTLIEWQAAVDMVNSALWKYVEVLEGSTQELILQISSHDLRQWTRNYYDIVAAFKELIAHRIEDLIWVIKRLENLFLAYRFICRKHKNLWLLFGKWLGRFTKVLDDHILGQLFRAEETLSIQFKKFSVAIDAFLALEAKAANDESKFRSYPVFVELSDGQQNLLLKVYRFIKIWEENAQHEILKGEDIVTSIKNLAKTGTVTLLFKEYYHKLELHLFALSKDWHTRGDKNIMQKMPIIFNELTSFVEMVGCYREMFLRSDPNPYVRTRWGVTEWIVGPEPRKTKDLLYLLYEVEKLSRWYHSLATAIQRGNIDNRDVKRYALIRQIDEVLHEMAQPLTAKQILENKAKALISLLEEADELGGSLGDVEVILTDTFLRALRCDIKYQILHDFPRFEELYAIHRGFLPTITNNQHIQRIRHLAQVFHHVEHWLKSHDLPEHQVELEVDEAAIQEEMQQWFASIQRTTLPVEKEQLYMLLEVRYIVSLFFHKLRQAGTEGSHIRSQFAFVDYYLDAIERKLREEPSFDALFENTGG